MLDFYNKKALKVHTKHTSEDQDLKSFPKFGNSKLKSLREKKEPFCQSHSGSLNYNPEEELTYYVNDLKVKKKFDRLTEIIKRRYRDNEMKYKHKNFRERKRSLEKRPTQTNIFVQNNYTYIHPIIKSDINSTNDGYGIRQNGLEEKDKYKCKREKKERIKVPLRSNVNSFRVAKPPLAAEMANINLGIRMGSQPNLRMNKFHGKICTGKVEIKKILKNKGFNSLKKTNIIDINNLAKLSQEGKKIEKIP